MDFLSNFVDLDAMINFIYIVSCLVFFGVLIHQAMLSLPRLRRAVIITVNSVLCVIVMHDKKYFSKQRYIDLGRTVPRTATLFLGALASVALAIFQAQVAIESQGGIAFGMLSCFAIYLFLDLQPDSQELSFSKWRRHLN